MNPYNFFSEIKNDEIKNFLISTLSALLILFIGWWLSSKLTNVICKALKKAKIDLGIISFSRSIIKIVFRIIVVLTTLSTIGLNITSLIAALGAAFVTVGIALKDSLSNIASGIIIIINKPFKVGDFLEFDDFCGTVSKIELIFTTLISPDNKEIVIPNSKIASNNIINSNKKSIRRLDLSYSPKTNFDINKSKIILNEIISKNDKILNEPCPKIFIDGNNFDEIKYTLNLWCKTADYNSLKNEINEKILYSFKNENSNNN